MTFPYEIFKCADDRWFKVETDGGKQEQIASDRGRNLVQSGSYEYDGKTSFHRFWKLKYEIRKQLNNG